MLSQCKEATDFWLAYNKYDKLDYEQKDSIFQQSMLVDYITDTLNFKDCNILEKTNAFTIFEKKFNENVCRVVIVRSNPEVYAYICKDGIWYLVLSTKLRNLSKLSKDKIDDLQMLELKPVEYKENEVHTANGAINELNKLMKGGF